ncbi:methyltransferase domain-containing protein [candidate division KSB1 bacterium]|nr:methyltransferase domain-containing protein [candidate division KSB1 bacterium]
MNSKQIAQFVGNHVQLRKWSYFIIFITTLREWHIREGIKFILKAQKANFSLLDAGFGMGQHLYRIARKYPQARLSGIEEDVELVEDFRAFIDRMGIRTVTLRAVDLLESKPVPKTDVALCCSVLEHIREDERALARLTGRLEDNGYLLIYVPTAERRVFKSLSRTIARVSQKKGDTLPHGHVRYYTPQELVRKVSRAGLTILQTRVTYGPVGRLAYDIVTAVQYSKYFLLVFPFYLLFIHPFVLILMMIDYLQTHDEGNGFMCIARKQAV